MDYGLSKSYLKHSGKHIELEKGLHLVGTARYASINALKVIIYNYYLLLLEINFRDIVNLEEMI